MAKDGQITDDPVHNLILNELKDIKKDISNVDSQVGSLRKQIFEGNGQKSLAEKINKNSMVTSVLVWCVGVLYVSVVGTIITVLVKKIMT